MWMGKCYRNFIRNNMRNYIRNNTNDFFRYCSARKSMVHFDPLILGWSLRPTPHRFSDRVRKRSTWNQVILLITWKSKEICFRNNVKKFRNNVGISLILFRSIVPKGKNGGGRSDHHQNQVVFLTTWKSETRLDTRCPAYNYRALYPLYPLAKGYNGDGAGLCDPHQDQVANFAPWKKSDLLVTADRSFVYHLVFFDLFVYITLNYRLFVNMFENISNKNFDKT